MTVLPMLAKGPGIFMNFVAVLFVLVCIVLVLVVLIQKGRGGGLSGAFGGGMAGSLLGSKTGDFLTWVTIVLVGVFLLLAIVLARFYRPSQENYGASNTPAATSSPTGGAEAGVPAADDLTNEEATPAEMGTDMTSEPTEAVPTEAAPTPVVPTEPNTAGG